MRCRWNDCSASVIYETLWANRIAFSPYYLIIHWLFVVFIHENLSSRLECKWKVLSNYLSINITRCVDDFVLIWINHETFVRYLCPDNEITHLLRFRHWIQTELIFYQNRNDSLKISYRLDIISLKYLFKIQRIKIQVALKVVFSRLSEPLIDNQQCVLLLFSFV